MKTDRTAHSKSEFARRTATGDTKVLPPSKPHSTLLGTAQGVSIMLVSPPTPKARVPAPDAVFSGYSRAQLEAAFARVKPANWKDPINAHIPHADSEEEMQDQLDVIGAAVAFYTGSCIEADPDALGTTVTAAGYYLTIGS